MQKLPLIPMDVSRRVAKEPAISLLNRFAEQNRALTDEPVALIARPGLKKFAEVGTGPIRKTFTQPGVFDDALFVVSGTDLYKVKTDADDTFIGQVSQDLSGSVSMAATAPIGDTVPAYLFLACGSILWVYTDLGSAQANLTVTSSVADNDTISINGVYYRWTSGSVDAGTPAGSASNPWLVKLGSSTGISLTNMYNAIGASGQAGVDYTTALLKNAFVVGASYSATQLYVIARDAGIGGNSFTLTESGSGMAWNGATMTGGGVAQLRQVFMPEDYGAISVAVINSYVIAIPVQETSIKGRFYWIEPGEKTVDPLNFATAERNPDGVLQVVVFGDMFWLLGQNTTEPWITTGNQDAPMQRFRGILFDRGSWEGTAVQVKNSLIVVDEDGAVFQIGGGEKRISRPDIEERIRRAKQIEKLRNIG